MKVTAKRNLKAGLNILIGIVSALILIFIVPNVIVYFMPFVVGWIISCIANPMVRFLSEKIKLKRKASSVLVILLVIGAIAALGYGIIYVLVQQIVGFVGDLPTFWDDMQESLFALGNTLEVMFNGFPDVVQDGFVSSIESLDETFSSLTETAGTFAVNRVSETVKNFPMMLISIIMGLLSAYFFVAERESFLNFFRKILTKSMLEKIQTITSNLKKAVGGYFIAQLKIEFYVYILLVIGFFVLDVKYALLIALGMALLDMLPFFGTAIILVPWAIFNFIEADYTMTIGLLIMWGASQLLRQFIQPKIVGDSIGVEPIPTLFLLFIGYRVGGVIGMIFAVPLGIIVIKLNEAGAFDTFKNSIQLITKSINDFRRITVDDIDFINEDAVTDEDLENMHKEAEEEEKKYSDLEYKKIELPITPKRIFSKKKHKEEDKKDK